MSESSRGSSQDTIPAMLSETVDDRINSLAPFVTVVVTGNQCMKVWY